jgi:hypothetical protein
MWHSWHADESSFWPDQLRRSGWGRVERGRLTGPVWGHRLPWCLLWSMDWFPRENLNRNTSTRFSHETHRFSHETIDFPMKHIDFPMKPSIFPWNQWFNEWLGLKPLIVPQETHPLRSRSVDNISGPGHRDLPVPFEPRGWDSPGISEVFWN